MGVRSNLQTKANQEAPGFSSLFANLLVDDSAILGTETVTEAATACSTTVPVTIIDNDGDEALSLADGSNVGQLKIFISSTNNTVTLTPATTAGSYSTIATTNIGETYGLMWTADGWAVIMRASGDTQADNAVDDLPVLA
jgi:hypothetical protein